MNRAKRLQQVSRVTHDRESAEARVLVKCLKIMEEKQARLLELEQYQGEYVKRYMEIVRTGTASCQADDYRRFLEKLEYAVDQQRRITLEAVRNYEAQHLRWTNARTKAKALDKVMEKCRLDEHNRAEKKEQRESDDRSQRVRSDHEG